MFFRSILATTTFLLVSASAQLKPAAIVVIEASHGGAGQGLTNITVTIPLTSVYTNATALREVSTLYLVDTRNTPLSSVSCTPFKNDNGTGKGGLTFDSTTPSYLSTNTVQVGSIVCISTDISFAPPGGLSSSQVIPLSTSLQTTTRAPHAKTSAHTTSQATTTASEVTTTAAHAQTTQASSSSASVSQATGNAASMLGLSGELFGGLAMAGFGLAFAL